MKRKDVLRVKPGPTLKETQVKSLRDAFEFFISRNIMDITIKETNKKGKTLKGSNWSEVNFIEMNAFIGILFGSGAMQVQHRSIHQLWTSDDANAIKGITLVII